MYPTITILIPRPPLALIGVIKKGEKIFTPYLKKQARGRPGENLTTRLTLQIVINFPNFPYSEHATLLTNLLHCIQLELLGIDLFHRPKNCFQTSSHISCMQWVWFSPCPHSIKSFLHCDVSCIIIIKYQAPLSLNFW